MKIEDNGMNIAKINNEFNKNDGKIMERKTNENKIEKLDEKKIDELVKKMNEKADNIQKGIRFEKEENIKQWVIKVYDTKTGETIRQIPTEESVKILKAMDETIGNILDMKL